MLCCWATSSTRFEGWWHIRLEDQAVWRWRHYDSSKHRCLLPSRHGVAFRQAGIFQSDFVWKRDAGSTSLKGVGEWILSWIIVLSASSHLYSWRSIWTRSFPLLLGLPSDMNNDSWEILLLCRHVTCIILVQVSFTFHRVDPWHLSPFCTCNVFLPVGLVECNKATVAMVRTARYCSQRTSRAFVLPNHQLLSTSDKELLLSGVHCAQVSDVNQIHVTVI
jgi:hypothetical protein